MLEKSADFVLGPYVVPNGPETFVKIYSSHTIVITKAYNNSIT